MTTLELLTEYLHLYFETSAPEKLLSLLSSDIHCYGVTAGVEVENIEEAKALLASVAYQKFTAYELTILRAQELSPENAIVVYTLKHQAITMRYRLIGASRQTENGRKLCLLNFSQDNPEQEPNLFEEQARANRERLAQSLVYNSMPGGVMGGYIEPGFPFYYINDTMLRYLGYADEAEFVTDIDGLVDRCMHPEDREAVNQMVNRQIEQSGQYVVDYRMRKKDGSYIWIHDIGKKIKAEDGRDAIISACSDITAEKDHERFLDGLVTSLNGDLAMLAVDIPNRRTLPVFVSEDMGGKQGLSRDSYLRQYQSNAMESIYEGDRERVWGSILDALRSEKTPSISFRVLDGSNQPNWINAAFSRYGEDNGMPVILVLFTASTVQNDLQMHALSQDGFGIALIDADSHELYYVNDSMFHMLDLPVIDYVGKSCPEVLHGCGDACEHCQLKAAADKNALDKLVSLNGKWFSAHAERRSWQGKQVVCVYLRDVTEQQLLQRQVEATNRELRQEEELLRSACDFAHIWTWVYDIPNNRIFPSVQLQRDFGMPKVLEDYPASWFAMDFIQPEYIELHRQKVQAVRDGSDGEEFDVRIRHKDGSLHWSRIQLNRMEKNPSLAICTAQLIDGEKILQARVNLENRKTLSADQSMLDYVITNVTKGNVMARNAIKQGEALLTMEQAMELARPLLHEKDRERYCRLHDRAMLLDAYKNGETSFEFVGHRVNADGICRWTRCTLSLLEDPTNGDVLLYEYVYDIHAQKIAEEILSATARFDYERVASVNLPEDQMTVLDAQAADTLHALEVLSYSKRLHDYCMTTVLPEDRDRFLEAIRIETVLAQLADKDKYEHTTRVIEANGSVGYRRTRFSFYNREMGICLMTRTDVTNVMRQEEERTRQIAEALKQARDALEAREKADREKQLLCAALFGIMPMVISANVTQGFYSMLNYDHFTTKKAPRSGTYRELIEVGKSTLPQEQQDGFEQAFCREHVLRAYENGEKSIVLVHQQWGDDGVLRWIETRCIFVKDERTGDLHTITLAQDISARKQEQLDLQKALDTAESATQAKSEFLSRMSHEIRTPMNAIMGMTAIAKENSADFAQVKECLDKIDASGHFLLTLINDILEMSRIESGRTEIHHTAFSFDLLIESIRTIVEPLALKSGLRYEFLNNAHTDSSYMGDSMRIQQVLVNLITNAIKFTKPNGRVRFSVNIDEETAKSSRFRFVVSDTGIGMSEAFMQRIFQPFTQEDGSNTSEYGGSGLGLAIAKSLVSAMGGSLRVESMVGIGSTFTVLLTLDRMLFEQAASEPSEKGKPAFDLSVLKGSRVLMAEDHPLNVMVARKLLERKGMLVDVAENGRLAVDKFSVSSASFYKAVLMDIRMPVMDGLDATRAIRSLDRTDARLVPIIAMTANALDEDRQHTREAGMNAHLAKPIEPALLYQTLAEWIAKRTI